MKFTARRGRRYLSSPLGFAYWPALCAGLLAIACNRTAPPAPAPAPASPAAVGATSAGTTATAASDSAPRVYGAPLTPDKPTELGALLANPEPFRSRAVTVEGQVRKACTRKGCWMELASSMKDGSPGCRITFKDYGFFVPTDSAGTRARVQGLVEVDTLSAAAVRHYEEEGAVFVGKKSDGTAPEVRLVATGVQLWRDPKASANN